MFIVAKASFIPRLCYRVDADSILPPDNSIYEILHSEACVFKSGPGSIVVFLLPLVP